MKSGTVPLAILVALCILGGVVWVGRGSPLPVADPPKPADEEETLPISEKGPYPKVVVDESEYDFGVLEVAEEEKHTFVIRNEGEAELELKKGTTTCKCTVSKLATSKIPVGESVEIEITWKGTEVSEQFHQTVTIHTNDPKNRQIVLVITGRIQDAVVMDPADGWNVGELPKDEPTKVTGLLHSAIEDEFKVLGIDSSDELLTAEAVPLSEKELENLRAKSGYSIQVILQPSGKRGNFHGQLTIRTDVGDGTDFSVTLSGRRPGPLRIWPLRGVKWYGGTNTLNLGTFDAGKGGKADLQLFVNGLGEKEFEFTDIQKNPKYLNVTLTPDTKFRMGDRKRYLLTFEVPPGSPASSYLRGSLAKVTVTTNHPEVETLEFRLQFICK